MNTVAASARTFDWRVPILVALIAALCAVFWLDSRYPSLQGKASADPDEALATPLGFEKHWPEPGVNEPLKHVAWSAAEWAITNKQGMTFGLLLAAGLLTLVPLVPAARGGRFAGAAQGMLVGTPLGVCINCAAPIGQAMLKGGARVEVALATMFASPSFNVIVLGILASLFPFYLVAIKVATSALMVLVIVPWLSQEAEKPGVRKPILAPPPKMPGLALFQWLERAFGKAEAALLQADGYRPQSFGSALAWVGMRYPRNLWTVLKLALPLMLLAGVIGAAMAELLPWGKLAAISHVEGFFPNLAVLALVAAFGTVLPVPIAFDIIVCAVLWDAGVPPALVAALLVSLGIYSVYPFSLIGTTLSWRIATLAGVAVFALSMLAGGAAYVLNGWHELRLARDVQAILDSSPAPSAKAPMPAMGRSAADLKAGAVVLPAGEKIAESDGAQLIRAAFQPASPPGEKSFTRIDGAALGFERLPLPRAYQLMEPSVMHLGPLASADLNLDGWPDIAAGTAFGVQLYLNLGGRFALQSVDSSTLQGKHITALALADLDGDGAPDLVACAWMSDCTILFNRDGAFTDATRGALPRGKERSVQSLALADVDRDGDLDIVSGATAYVPRFFNPATAVNRLWRNNGSGVFSPEALAGPEGETLTLLFHDFNADSWPDLYVGNDFDEPDRIYLNDRGKLLPATGDARVLPKSPYDTMSADAGDLDNDGIDEIYTGGISMGSPGASFAAKVAQPLPSCEVYRDIADRSRCDAIARFQLATFRAYSTQSMAPCEQLADAAERRDCAVSAYHWNRVLARLPVLGADAARIQGECASVPGDFVTMRDICAVLPESPMDHEQSDEGAPGDMAQVKQTNLLYRGVDKGDITKDWKAGVGGWTWNARFADLDNDGWQDLHITQGTRLRPNSPSAIYDHNKGGEGFEDLARASGLEDHNPTGASLFVDYDQDGDLDLVTQPFFLSPVVFRNDKPAGEGLEITLDDARFDNRAGIGARVMLTMEGGGKQVRELRLSGGYQSLNPPVAHFGLGGKAVTGISVRWPDGSSSEFAGAFPAGRYRVTRR